MLEPVQAIHRQALSVELFGELKLATCMCEPGAAEKRRCRFDRLHSRESPLHVESVLEQCLRAIEYTLLEQRFTERDHRGGHLQVHRAVNCNLRLQGVLEQRG